MQNIWGNVDDYWTSEEDESVVADETKPCSDSITEELVAKTVDLVLADKPPRTDPLAKIDDRPEWLIKFEEERLQLEETGNIGRSSLLADVNEDREKQPAIQAPEREGHQFVRKRWVIEDNRDVSNFDEILPLETRAMTHPFEYDDFQKRAILHVANNEHIFVCAHTSAGKTVVAEYGIAMAASYQLRAIYTCPIKALSNQKFREFSGLFPSVGIITGDLSVNTAAQCLIMTTEILRSLLYRNDPLLAQLGLVIYDEVHYVNDAERGVVWEETIIMLPHHVNMILLSATVPNYLQFANWIGLTKQKEVFTVSTKTRPTPLKHFIWALERPFLLMDDRGHFNTNVYNLIYNSSRSNNSTNRGAKGSARGGASKSLTAKTKTEKQNIGNFIHYLRTHEGLPVVCFCFSRKKCEALANSVSEKLVDMGKAEKSKCHIFVETCIKTLAIEDRDLPQIKFVSSLIEKGVGIHHGALLPIVKEIVELLFSRGLIQVLFATETFAMGINMPARSVLFTAITKHDGRGPRPLFPSEYTQIAGRAGRRGLDTSGNVYIFTQDLNLPDIRELSSMMLHRATPLHSKFRLTFHMLLQLFSRQEGLKPLQMIAKSFKESSRAQQIPRLKKSLTQKTALLDSLPELVSVFDSAILSEYIQLVIEARNHGFSYHSNLFRSKLTSKVFTRGRIILLHTLPFTYSSCFGLIIDTPKMQQATNDPLFTILVLLGHGADINASINPQFYKNYISSEDQVVLPSILHLSTLFNVETLEDQIKADIAGDYCAAHSFAIMVDVPLNLLGTIMNESIVSPPDFSEFRDDSNKGTKVIWWTRMAKILDDYLKTNNGEVTPFTLPKSAAGFDLETTLDANEVKKYAKRILEHPVHRDPNKEEIIRQTLYRNALVNEIEEIKFHLSEASLDLIPDMEAKIEFLKRRKFINPNGSIALKGRAACEVISSDEITLIEAMFENVFKDKSPVVLASVLSAFVSPETSEEEEVRFDEEVEEVKNDVSCLSVIYICCLAIAHPSQHISGTQRTWCKAGHGSLEPTVQFHIRSCETES